MSIRGGKKRTTQVLSFGSAYSLRRTRPRPRIRLSGDAGVPRRSGALTRFNNFGPRLSLAYTPHFKDGILHSIFSDEGKSSIRAGFGMYYTNVEGRTHSTSQLRRPTCSTTTLPRLVRKPFVNRDSGAALVQRFPLPAVNRQRSTGPSTPAQQLLQST